MRMPPKGGFLFKMIQYTPKGTLVFYVGTDKLTLSFHKVYEALLKLHFGDISNPQTGICGNISDYYRSANHRAIQFLVGKLAANWEHYSGTPQFPIPSSYKGVSDHDMFMRTENMWSKKTKYGKLRWKLLVHLMNELNNIKHQYELYQKVTLLVAEANMLGFTVSVDNVPTVPLSMGNTKSKVDVRRSRGNY